MSKEVKTAEQMESELLAAKTKTVVVDFFATWCGPCQKIAPKLQEFVASYPNVVTLKVNVDEAMDLAEKYEISAMPTFLAFKDGALVDTVIGADLTRVEELYKRHDLGTAALAPAPVPVPASGILKATVVNKNIQIVEVLDNVTAAVNVQATATVSPVDS